MAKMSESIIPPISRLSSDIWSILGEYLETNAVLRLINTGNKALIETLRQGVHTLSLAWSVIDYIEFLKLFKALSYFKTIYQLEFTSLYPQTLHWFPVNWTLFPKELAILKVSFSGSVCSLLGNGNLKLILPNLETLIIKDDMPDIHRREKEPIDFRGLPETLRTLRITKGLSEMCLQHLKYLPPFLETLDLDLYIHHEALDLPAIEGFEDASLQQMAFYPSTDTLIFPTLPDSLTFLRINEPLNYEWMLKTSNLPKSLRSFYSLAQSPLVNDLEPNTFLKLSELYLPFSVLAVEDLESFLDPSSLTYLHVFPSYNSESSFRRYLQRFGHALVHHVAGRLEDVDDLVLHEEFNLPRLKEINATDEEVFGSCSLPSLTKLISSGIEFADGALPPSLESWKDLNVNLDHLAELNFGKHLRELNFSLHPEISADIVQILPPSLETLVACLLPNTWPLLSNGTLFPNLKEIVSYRYTPLEYLAYVPNQLQSLMFTISHSEFPLFLPNKISESLTASNLEKLILRFPKTLGGDELSTYIELLNALPKSLKSLFISSEFGFSAFWDVTLPPKLRKLAIKEAELHPSAHPSAHPSTFSGDSGSDLPSTLHTLKHNAVLEQIPFENLPPFLSRFEPHNEDLRIAYYQSKTPPSSNPRAVLLEFRPENAIYLESDSEVDEYEDSEDENDE